MKANELRIGNIVYANNVGTHPSNSYLESHTIADGKDIENAMWYFPILLTEEWLLKFGFKRKHFECDLRQWWYNGFYVSDLNGLYARNVLLKYVHQLQNLYFALTGEELTIKTK